MRWTSLLVLPAAALGWCGTAGAAQYEMHMVNMGPHDTFEFEPALLVIQPGDTVHFVAVDKGHDIQSIPGMIPPGAEPIKSAMNKDLTVTFSKPGVYGIECLPHFSWGMVGLIAVGDPSVNLAEAKKVSVPAKARQVFATLFQEVEQRHAANRPATGTR
jgi:pseudoazurin